MAAYLNRTVSMMSGDGPHNRSSLAPLSDYRAIRTPAADNSPLQIFVKAKKKINDIFVEIEDYVDDAVDYMNSKLNYLYQTQIIYGSYRCTTTPTNY